MKAKISLTAVLVAVTLQATSPTRDRQPPLSLAERSAKLCQVALDPEPGALALMAKHELDGYPRRTASAKLSVTGYRIFLVTVEERADERELRFWWHREDPADPGPFWLIAAAVTDGGWRVKLAHAGDRVTGVPAFPADRERWEGLYARFVDEALLALGYEPATGESRHRPVPTLAER